MTSVSSVPLRAGNGATIDIPQLGFGTWEVPDADVTDAVSHALATGYRSVDTAAIYGNEEGVGRALAATDIPREQIFVTTKVWNDAQGYEPTIQACRESLARLGQEYVDLYLMHWPVPSADRYVDTWKAMLQLRADGLIRAAGVCNFNADHLRRLGEAAGELPALNQIEIHPYFNQGDLRAFHRAHDIATEDWSPLGARANVLADESLAQIATQVDRTVAQVVLRWHLQIGSVVIPRSVTPHRIEENFAVGDFELSQQQLDTVSGLDRGQRTGPDPENFSLGA